MRQVSTASPTRPDSPDRKAVFLLGATALLFAIYFLPSPRHSNAPAIKSR
jgi:hypothetical protein